MTRKLVRDLFALDHYRAGGGGDLEETSQGDFIDLLWAKLPEDVEALVRQRGKYPLMLDQMAEVLATLVEILKAYPPAQEDPLTDLITVMNAKELIHGGYRGGYVLTTED